MQPDLARRENHDLGICFCKHRIGLSSSRAFNRLPCLIWPKTIQNGILAALLRSKLFILFSFVGRIFLFFSPCSVISSYRISSRTSYMLNSTIRGLFFVCVGGGALGRVLPLEPKALPPLPPVAALDGETTFGLLRPQ